MRFRRRRGNVYDIEAARMAAAGMGAYDPQREVIFRPMPSDRPERREALGPYTHHSWVEFNNGLSGQSPETLYDDNGRVPTVSEQPSEADASGGRPALSVVSADTDRAGPSKAKACDEWARDYKVMEQAYYKALEREQAACRDNDRLKSELNQAIAQARIARQERDKARNERDTAKAEASQHKGMQ